MPDNTPALTLHIDHTCNPIVVRCHGKLLYGTSDILYSQVKPLLPGSKRIVLDLTELIRMDSMGLGALVRLYVSARSAGCSLELMNLGKQVRLLLGTAHMLNAFTIVGEHGIKIN